MIPPAAQQLLQPDALRGVVFDDEQSIAGSRGRSVCHPECLASEDDCGRRWKDWQLRRGVLAGLALHGFPQPLDMGTVGGQRANRDAHHPPAVEQRRRQVGGARAVQPLDPAERVAIERFAAQALGFVPHADGLQRHRIEHPPRWRPRDLLGEPPRVREIAAEPRLQSRDALLADEEPELERAEAAAQRQAPVAEVLDHAIGGGLQIARVRRHHAHQMLRVAHVIHGAVERRAQPLVRIDDDRVGAFDAVPHPAALGQDHRRSRHRRIDVEPHAMSRGDRADRRQRIDGRRGRGAGRGDDRAGPKASSPIGGDCRFERLRAHRVVRVVRDAPDVLAAETREQRRFVDRAVTVRRRIDDQRRRLQLQPAAREAVVGGALARAQQRDQCARRRRVLNHAAPPVGQAEHLPQPVGGDFFDLGQRGTRLPRQSQHAESGAGVVAEHARQLAVAWEVAEERRVLPSATVRASRSSSRSRRIASNGSGSSRRRRRQTLFDFARRRLRHHRPIRHACPVISDPIDELMSVFAEFVGSHG